ncbi:MAG: thiolase family protein [Advenella sp.]
MSSGIYISGVGELPQGRSDLPDTMSLHAALCRLALADAQLDWSEIDAVLTVSPRSDPYLIHAAALSEYLDIQPDVTWTIEAGGAAPAAMLEISRGLISAGTCSNVLIVAADMPLGGVSRQAYVKNLSETGPVHPEYEVPYGPSVPSLFGLVARSYGNRWGHLDKALAAVALQNRAAACRHENAHFRDMLDEKDYSKSRYISEPLKLLDCAPVSDGGAALVVTGVAGARNVPVAGLGFSYSHMHLSAASDLCSFNAGEALDRALGQANANRNALDLALVYDCFTIAMLVNLEDMGLASRGQAGADFIEGRFSAEGDLPVNTHGGLLSHGHPARAGGIGNIVEGVIQVRGEAGVRQIVGTKLALAHGMGGVFATHGVALLGALS